MDIFNLSEEIAMKSQIFGDKTEPVARSVYSNNRPLALSSSSPSWNDVYGHVTRVVVERRFFGAGLRKLRSTHKLAGKVVYFSK